jgi:thioredoxin 1
MTELNNENYTDFIKDGIAIVDIWSPTCRPCLQLMPIIEEISTQMGETTSFGKLNAADFREKALSLNIRSIPTLLFYKNGKLITQTSGLQTSTQIKDIIKSL